jgi:uracil-DNA glycosylase family protein
MSAVKAPQRQAEPPATRDLETLRKAAASCTGCDLYLNATQTVFGEGPLRPALMMVGEQPGDQEDKQGRPFVGPAGGVLDRGLELAGIARDKVYMTNAVKHFKWTARGKRRIHETPRASEMRACRPWLEAEVEAVAPRLLVCLGAVAVASVLGPGYKVLSQRGQVFESLLGPALITVHPSSILRVDDSAEREAALELFVMDLKKATAWVERVAA